MQASTPTVRGRGFDDADIEAFKDIARDWGSSILERVGALVNSGTTCICKTHQVFASTVNTKSAIGEIANWPACQQDPNYLRAVDASQPSLLAPRRVAYLRGDYNDMDYSGRVWLRSALLMISEYTRIEVRNSLKASGKLDYRVTILAYNEPPTGIRNTEETWWLGLRVRFSKTTKLPCC